MDWIVIIIKSKVLAINKESKMIVKKKVDIVFKLRTKINTDKTNKTRKATILNKPLR